MMRGGLQERVALPLVRAIDQPSRNVAECDEVNMMKCDFFVKHDSDSNISHFLVDSLQV